MVNLARGVRTRALLVALALCESACEQVERLWTAELTGAVFLRMGSGETRPQGGIEVRLVAPEVKNEIDALQSRFDERVRERQENLASLEKASAALRNEVQEWQEETAEKIEIRVRSARPDLRNGWLHLDLSVLNGTQFRLTTVMYKLFCGDRLIPTIGENTMLLLGGLQKQFLEPGKTYRTPSWGETFHLARATRYTDEAKTLLTCPVKILRARSVRFGVFDPQSLPHSEFDIHRFATTPSIDNLRRSIQEFEARLKAIDSAGVTDLDLAIEKTLERYTKYSTRTDMDGRFRIERINPGAYVLAAFYSSAVDSTGWFVPMDLKQKTAQDLSNFNLSDPRFAEEWRAIVGRANSNGGGKA